MHIALLQTDIAWRDAAENERRVRALITAGERAEMYLLPEMWATGFDVHPDAETLRAGRRGLTALHRLAAETGAVWGGSLPVDGERGPVNRFYVVHPDGTEEYYDKRHLFTYGGEHHAYHRGDRRAVVTIAGVRILLQVCYDLRFPVFSRNRGEYDLALYVASWPASRRAAWDTLLRARAIENQCYVCGVNRVGVDPACRYDGGTAAIDARGHCIAAVADNTAGRADFIIDMEALRAFREKFPVLRDAD